MTTALTTQEWHARAKALRYATGHFIDGEHIAAGKARFTVINPATNEPLCEVAAGSAADIAGPLPQAAYPPDSIPGPMVEVQLWKQVCDDC